MNLIDGDILCYRIGYAVEKESHTDRYISDVLNSYLSTLILRASSHEDFQVYITGKNNYRNKIATTAPYKGTRKKEKPSAHQLVRDLLCENWGAIIAEGEEADDAIAIKATELGDDCVMCSVDKDFDQVPGWHYNFVKHHKYYVTPEEGLLFFYRQILMGDRVDNIIGIKGIGEKKSLAMLEGLTEQEMYAKCIEVHEEDSPGRGVERVLENARLLWLRREPDEVWQPPEMD